MSSLFTLDLAIEYRRTFHHPCYLCARIRAPYDHSIHFLTFGRCCISSMTLRALSLAIPYPSLYFSLFPFSSPLHVEYLCHIILSLHMDIPDLAFNKARQPWPVYPFVIFVCFCSPRLLDDKPSLLYHQLSSSSVVFFALLIPSADRFTIRQHRLLSPSPHHHHSHCHHHRLASTLLAQHIAHSR